MDEKQRQDYQNNPEFTTMYSFYDTKASSYGTPFFCHSDLFAGRHYKMVSEQEGLIKSFKKDFEVHRLGYFNIKNATFVEDLEVIIEGKNQKQETK